MAVLDRYAGLVIDLDGVVFRLEQPIPGAFDLLRRLERDGPPTVFVTNNATRAPEAWTRLFAAAGLEVGPDRVLTSAMAAAWLLAGDLSPTVLAVGEEGLLSVLTAAGLLVTTDHEEAEAVVVGWNRHVTWDELRRATLAIHRGARFIGTNADPVYPAPEGPWPGNGAQLAFLYTATGVAPEVAGKPETPLFELAAERLGVGDRPILVVGDQLETDILAAERMGWDSALVLTGVSREDALSGASVTPTWVVRGLHELAEAAPRG